MPRTAIKVSNVINASSKGTTAKSKVSGAETGIGNTRSAIDWKILNRNNINNRLINVKNSVGQIEDDIAEICAAINSGALKYQSAETTVVSLATEVTGGVRKNQKPGLESIFSNYFHEVAIDSNLEKKTAQEGISASVGENASISDNVDNVEEVKGSQTGPTDIDITLTEKGDNVEAVKGSFDDPDCAVEYGFNDAKKTGGAINKIKAFLPGASFFNKLDLKSKGLKFSSTKGTDGRIYLHLDNSAKRTKKEVEALVEKFVTDAEIDKLDLKHLINNDGLPIYTKKGNLTTEGKWLDEHVLKSGLDGDDGKKLKVLDVSSELAKHTSFSTRLSNMGKVFGTSFKKELVNSSKGFVNTFTGKTIREIADFSDFKSLSKMEKVGDLVDKGGKTLGVIGDVLTAGTNVIENNFNPTTNTWEFTPKSVISTVTDVAIDIGAGAGAAAAGAAIGSLVVPPVGTVVGAVAGLAVDYVVNELKFDLNGDGEANSLVDVAKKGVDAVTGAVVDGVGALVDGVGGLFKKWGWC